MNRLTQYRPRRQKGGLKLWLAAGLATLIALILLALNYYGSPSLAQTVAAPVPAEVKPAALSAVAVALPAPSPIQAANARLLHPAIQAQQSYTTNSTPKTNPATKAIAMVPAVPIPAKSQTAGVAPTELLLEVHINQQPWHETDLFLGFGTTPDKNVYAKGSDLERWRLRPPAVQPTIHQDEKYYPLDAIPGITYRVDP
ncbi:MAG: hypothetical protein ACRERZ_08055, partial [Gammaproteobacteria bacterium]